ncbi:LOW QUALITY PROTEIN: TBC1 domain family member 12-like [Scomber scombrus]|uniref:LOW QUALITY PROTEIN: TBC1 domain family member 12-like n=1 Tax=Scomber scombrus TaxID=13677 RepID=A0AAV1Q4K0_SCOSC
METAGQDGGSITVDLNENEEGDRGGEGGEEGEGGGEGRGGGEGEGGHTSYTALKDRGIGLLAGVSRGQEAGKGRGCVYVTGNVNGRNVNRDGPTQQHQHREIMLDLVAVAAEEERKFLPNTGLVDHRGLNGFTEEEEEEMKMVSVVVGQVTGESEGTVLLDNGAVTGCIRASLPGGLLPCSGKQQQNCASTPAEAPEVNIPNGGVDMPRCGGTGAEIEGFSGNQQLNCACTPVEHPDLNMPNGCVDRNCACSPADVPDVNIPNGGVDGPRCGDTGAENEGFPSPKLGHGLGLCDAEGEEVTPVMDGQEESGMGMVVVGRVTGEKEGMVSLDNGAVTGCTHASLPGGLLPCLEKQHLNCACTPADVPEVNIPNGGVDIPRCGGTGAEIEGFSSPKLGHRLGLCEVEGEEVSNGCLHIVNTGRETCDRPESDCSPQNGHLDPGVRQENCSEGLSSECPCEDAPAAEKLPHTHPTSLNNSPTPASSAKLPSPCPSPPSSQLSEPITRGEEEEEEDEGEEEEEGFSDLSLPVRPHTLRTTPNLAVSLSCDATPLSPDEDGGFYFGDEGYEEDLRSVLEAGRRQSAPETLPDLTGQTDSSDSKLMPKRFGIAEFFTRSLFSRKSKEPKAPSHNATGWRLFGKTSAREDDAAKEADPSTQEDEQVKEDSGASSPPQRPSAAGRRKNLEFEPLSTTALILEDRPLNLPAKSMEETQRHKLEYEEMVAGAKRRELKEAQRKKRQMKERHRQEDSISNAMVIWNTEILPNWDSMKGTRRVRDLWWQGLPPSVRGRVWSLAIGNELNITPELYEIFLCRAKEKWRSYSETSSVNDNESDGGASLADRESSLDLIKLDISRTFPSLFIFQKGGPYHDLLHSVLGAYTCYRPDIGYVQGMSFIAAVLILNLEEAEAFITFANLLNKPCQMAFFRVDHELMLKYFAVFEVFFEENLPRLFSHFQTNSLTPDLFLIDWIFTLYSKSLPLDMACRVWDVFCRDGEESLFRTGLGILRLYEDVLLQMDFIHIAQFLTRLPEDLQSHTLFTAMANTHMVSRNRRWAQVFSASMKEGNRETDKNSSPALRS